MPLISYAGARSILQHPIVKFTRGEVRRIKAPGEREREREKTLNDVNAGSCCLLMRYARQGGPGEAGCVQYLYNIIGSLSCPHAL